MPDCTAEKIVISRAKRRVVEVDFGGGAVSSDGGLVLLREVDRRLRLTERVAAVLNDARDPDLIIHPLIDLIRQRVYGIVQGYEDLNDHAELRQDLLLQSVLERDRALASAPTLCRLENRASRAAAWALHRELVQTFIGSFKQAPEELVLDFDATDDPVHGQQEGLLPRLLRQLLLPAAVCVLRRAVVGVVSAALEDRWRQACLGGARAAR